VIQKKELKAQSANLLVKYTSRVILLYFLVLYKRSYVLSAVKTDNRHVSSSSDQVFVDCALRFVCLASENTMVHLLFVLKIHSNRLRSDRSASGSSVTYAKENAVWCELNVHIVFDVRSGKGPSFSTVFLSRRRDAFYREVRINIRHTGHPTRPSTWTVLIDRK